MTTALPTSRRRVRAFRDLFTVAEFERHEGFFWPMPSAWANTSILRDAWKLGGVGAVSLLPILGRYGHWDKASRVPLSLEECARLGGCDVGSIQRGARALKTLGLATTELSQRHGQTITNWNISKAMAAVLRAGKLDSESFRFDSRLIYAGTWSMITGTQRAVYLAIATLAYTYSLDDGVSLLRSAVVGDATIADVEEVTRGESSTAKEAVERLRIAEASVAQVSRILGMSQSAVHEAINGFKDAGIWPGSRATAQAVRHAPLRVYPTRPGRSNVFVFRDHAPLWPLDAVNARLRSE